MGSSEADWRAAFALMKDRAGAAKEDWFENQSPQRQVKLSREFEIGKFEITQAQWQAVMGTTLPEQRDKLNPQRKLWGEGERFPIYFVSWEEAAEFCRRLNEMSDGYFYRLPTEAEWEYAARAGTSGDHVEHLNETAWFADNSGRKSIDSLEIWRTDSENFFDRLADNGGRAHPVGGKHPNAFGLYDMQGNVWEWTADWFGKYTGEVVTDPQGAPDGDRKVLSGASWDDTSVTARFVHRFPALPSARFLAAGFRVVRERKIKT